MHIEDPLIQFLGNKVAQTTFLAWFSAQSFKVVFGIFREKRFNFKWFVGTGGMPSSHAAGVTALATSIGIQDGVGSSIFAVTLLFAIIVLCDAQGVRRSTGQQAEVLNRIMDDIYWKKHVREDRLKELIGHTPIQVLAGIGFGLVVALISYHVL